MKKMENLDLEDLLIISEPKRELNREVSILNKELINYKVKIGDLKYTQTSLQKIDLDGTEYNQLTKIVTQVYSRAGEFSKLLAEDQDRMGGVVQELDKADFQSLGRFKTTRRRNNTK